MTNDDPSALRARCDLDELETKAKAATPGPWTAGNWTIGVGHYLLEPFCDDHHDEPCAAKDLAFIAAANPAVVLDLVRRLREAEGIVRDLAASQRTVTTGHGESGCYMCGAPDGWPGGHMPNCLVGRAVEATRREEG